MTKKTLCIREESEEIERRILHPKATLSCNTKGREKPEEEGEIRTAFQRDRDRIIHSKSFRRLKHKTQVFLAPTGDHYRTRLTHTLEVSQIARTIAKSLRLNEELTEAIALGHDLGHTPFGHAGEAVLDEIYPGGFNHYEQSLRVVDFIEKDGHGLNLTKEVRDGILKHSKGKGHLFSKGEKNRAETLEGQIVRASDSIAYANHDLDDALRAGILKLDDVPSHIIKAIGETHSKRIDTMVSSIIYSSLNNGLAEITMGEDILSLTEELRSFLYKNVYENEITHREFLKAEKLLKELYLYYFEHPDEVFKEIPRDRLSDDKERLVCDFIAGMTDRYALMTYEKLFLPQPWLVM